MRAKDVKETKPVIECSKIGDRNEVSSGAKDP